MKSHVRILVALSVLILSATLSPAQTARPDIGGDTVKGAEATILLRQIEKDRAQLIEERRQALLKAEQAKTPEEKIKIMQELHSTQRERKTRLKEDTAKVREAEKQERKDKRAQSLKS